MKRPIALLILTVGLWGCATPNVSPAVKLDYQLSAMDGKSLASFIEDLGVFFDVAPYEDGYRIVVYARHTRSNHMEWVPVVGLVASGNGHNVERCEITFSSDDIFDGRHACAEVQGFSNMWTMPTAEGMVGNGGRRDHQAFERVQAFLADKGFFFDGDKWKLQNVAKE